MSLNQNKRARSSGLSSLGATSSKRRAGRAMKKQVGFATEEPKVHHFDPYNGHGPPVGSGYGSTEAGRSVGSQRTSQLTEELTVLSTLHGRARRELRDISKHDLKTVKKYGTRTRGRTVNGDQRWKYEFGNTIYITDNSGCKEITCYKKAVDIQHAMITQKMLDDHHEAKRILREDPHLCTTHSVIVIDQSASMKTCDVNSFRSRSDAAYGTLALDYIAEQLYQQGDELLVDAVSIVEMNDTGTLLFHKEPLDWILFNKVLDQMSSAKPRSHGSYVEALEFAEDVIKGELASFEDLDEDDIPAFMLVFISDGRPSDTLPEHVERRESAVLRLALQLKSKLTFFGMGIGASGSDFEQLRLLVNTAEEYGAEGQFVHAGLNPASLSTTLSSMATSMTTTRNDLLSTKDGKREKKEKKYTMKKKNEDGGLVFIRREVELVSRWLYDQSMGDYPWRQVPFFNLQTQGFEVEQDPFGKGAERLAYMFYEIKLNQRSWTRVGRAMVAKESRYIEDEQTKVAFHTDCCRVQNKAKELAKLFNEAVKRAPLLTLFDPRLILPHF